MPVVKVNNIDMKNFSRWGPAFELSRTLMKTMLARFLITRFLRLVNPQFSIQLDGTRPSQVPQPTWEVMSVGKPNWTWPDDDDGKTCVSLDQELSVQRLWEGRHSNNRGELKILQRPKTHYTSYQLVPTHLTSTPTLTPHPPLTTDCFAFVDQREKHVDIDNQSVFS